jgi:hypothetical protein
VRLMFVAPASRRLSRGRPALAFKSPKAPPCLSKRRRDDDGAPLARRNLGTSVPKDLASTPPAPAQATHLLHARCSQVQRDVFAWTGSEWVFKRARAGRPRDSRRDAGATSPSKVPSCLSKERRDEDGAPLGDILFRVWQLLSSAFPTFPKAVTKRKWMRLSRL